MNDCVFELLLKGFILTVCAVKYVNEYNGHWSQSVCVLCKHSRPFGPVPMVPGAVEGGPGVGLPLGAFAGSLQKLGGSHPGDNMMQFMAQPPPPQPMLGGTAGGMMFDGPTFEPIHIDPFQTVDYQNPMLASAESPAYTLDYAQQVCALSTFLRVSHGCQTNSIFLLIVFYRKSVVNFTYVVTLL